jgi:CRP/FNR family transcriptional regulator, cyclic AMP receptor protein
MTKAPLKNGEQLKKNTFALFKQMQLFCSFSDEELQDVASKATIKKFGKQQTVLNEEDSNFFMYMILKGKVKVVQMTEDGKEVILAVHRAGESFGEVSLIDGKTVQAGVVAMEESVIAYISKKEYVSLIQSHKKLLDNLLNILCSRLRESWDKIQLLSFTNASQRVKMLLHLLSDEYGKKTSEGVSVDIRLTHQDIANMIGISRETVTRIMDQWHKDGEISMVDKKRILLKSEFMRKDVRMDRSILSKRPR